MKTEQEIRTKLETILAQHEDYSDDCQRRESAKMMRTLQWVLGEGPEVVMVPKPPTVERTTTDAKPASD